MTEVIGTLIQSPEHVMAGHPESPSRFVKMLDWITNPPYAGISFVSAQPANHDDILRVHTPEMLLSLKFACSIGLQNIERAPTYVNTNTCDCMYLAAGGVLKLERMINSNEAKYGFAIVRPPGHHAGRDKPSGFCLLNNTAIGVADALENGCKKIAVIDFDGHHANGTQEIFQNDERVAVFSMHQEDIYPSTGGMQDQVKGRIINLPLPAGTGDEIFPQVSKFILEPWLRQLQPDMIFVSAGFDGHYVDPITGLGFTTDGYFSFASQIKDLVEQYSAGKLLFVLEGGYDPLALKESIQAVLCALSGEKEYPNSYGQNSYSIGTIESRVKLIAYVHQLI